MVHTAFNFEAFVINQSKLRLNFFSFLECSGSVLLRAAGQSAKKFQIAFEEYLFRIFRCIDVADLPTLKVLESLVAFLTSLSQTRSRTLRFGAVLSLYKLVDALIEVGMGTI